MDDRLRLVGIVSAVLFVCATVSAAAPIRVLDDDTRLCVGTAELDITPAIGMRLCGTFHERLSTGVHDPLYARAIVLSQGTTTLAVVGCDLAMMSPAVASQARTAIAASCGVEPNHVLIHASETHNGPDYFGEFRDAFHQRAVAAHGHDPAEPGDFSRTLAERIAECVIKAHQEMQPATLEYGEGRCEGVAFYRRFRMRDGSIAWNPGKMNPDIVRPTGPTDPTVPVIAIKQGNESTLTGMLAGFAMHLAILNDSEYGADYPYYLRRRLQGQLSPPPFIHFLQLPCCDVNHIDVSHDRPQTGHEWAERVGGSLADAVMTALPTLKALEAPDLAARARIVPVALRQFPPDEVARQRDLWFRGPRTGVGFLELVHAATVSGIYGRHEGGPVPVLLQAFRLDSDTALIGLPSEVSIELGLLIRKESPFRRTVVLQLSNDWLGYIPTKRIFQEGHYEAVVAKIRPGEGERMAREALSLLRELKSD